MAHEVISDGTSVWVNSDKTGACLGRFGLWGVDIHREPEEMQTKGACLLCTHERATPKDWQTFLTGMKEHYGVVVDEEHKPTWISRLEQVQRKLGTDGNEATHG